MREEFEYQERSDKEIAQAIFPLALILFTTVVGPIVIILLQTTMNIHCSFEAKCFIELIMVLLAIINLPMGFSTKFIYWCSAPCLMFGLGLLLQLKLTIIPIFAVEIVVFLCFMIFYREKLA